MWTLILPIMGERVREKQLFMEIRNGLHFLCPLFILPHYICTRNMNVEIESLGLQGKSVQAPRISWLHTLEWEAMSLRCCYRRRSPTFSTWERMPRCDLKEQEKAEVWKTRAHDSTLTQQSHKMFCPKLHGVTLEISVHLHRSGK